jgi:DNA-binding transcriptional LysR family regulator
MIELGRLRALRAVARYGTVTAAAQALHCTPSAISQHLTKLDREIGSTLVEKDGRRLRLTEAGRVLAEHAGRILAALEEAEAALAAHQTTVCGRLAIASFPTACRGLLPYALRQLAADHPQLEPELLESDPRISLDLVDRGEIDLALVDDWPEATVPYPPGVLSAPLGLDVADLVVPAGHRLARHPAPAALADLVDERWIASVPGTICHDWLTRVLPGVRPRFLVAEFESQLTLIAEGLGVALIPRLARTSLPEGVLALPLTPEPTRRVTIAWRGAAQARPAIGAAVEALRAAWQARTQRPVLNLVERSVVNA